MATPTQKLTERASSQLGDELVIAVRVRQGPAERAERGGRKSDPWESPSAPFPPFPAGGVPVVPMFRAVKHRLRDLISPDDERGGVLAFTRSGDRVLMGRSRVRSGRPTQTLRRLPADAPMSVDMALLWNELIPELRIGDDAFVVNSIDFGVFVRRVVEGDLDEPHLAEQLSPFYERAKALATYDPETFRAMMFSDPGSQDRQGPAKT